LKRRSYTAYEIEVMKRVSKARAYAKDGSGSRGCTGGSRGTTHLLILRPRCRDWGPAVSNRRIGHVQAHIRHDTQSQHRPVHLPRPGRRCRNSQRYPASISVIRSICAGRSHDETTRWLVNPLASCRRLDIEMVNPICASTDLLPVTATRLGCSIRSVHRWRPGRFETRSWMNCSAGTPPTELQKAIAAFVGTNKEAGPVRRLLRRECMRSSAVARPQINGPAPIPIQALPPTGNSSWPL
jgi:hypothetical protein